MKGAKPGLKVSIDSRIRKEYIYYIYCVCVLNPFIKMLFSAFNSLNNETVIYSNGNDILNNSII